MATAIDRRNFEVGVVVFAVDTLANFNYLICMSLEAVEE